MNKKIEKMLEIINKITKEQNTDNNDIFNKGKWKYLYSYDNNMEFYRITSGTHAVPLFIFKSKDNDDMYHVILADPTCNDYKGTLLNYEQIYQQLGINIKETERDILENKKSSIDDSLIDLISYELSEHINILKMCNDKNIMQSVIKEMLLQFSANCEYQPNIDNTGFQKENYKLTAPSSFSDKRSDDDVDEEEDDDDDDDD